MTVTPDDLRRQLLAGAEVALLDLREEGRHAEGHPLFAASLPLSRLELEIFDRVPRRSCPVILFDEDDGLVARAQCVLSALGYRHVHPLSGGLAGWVAAGYELFRDVNAPSKAFGEWLEAHAHTPSLPAEEVKRRLDAKADMVVLDVRRFDEYRTMNIPGGISVPGAELVLRAAALAPDPATTIIVNCAGRTRSLVGAQSLRNAGISNPVFALRNGTIGWSLAGFALEHGQTRRFTPERPARLRQAQAASRAVAERAGVVWIDALTLQHWQRDAGRTLYLFDVRDETEYRAGHWPGFRPVPGGQLVQETDHFAPVRGARMLLYDDLLVRAEMTASWLRQMGWTVAVLSEPPPEPEVGDWRPSSPPLPDVPLVTPDHLPADALLLDLGPSPRYRRGHVPGARFIIRARLPQDLPAEASNRPLVLISEDDRLARFAAADLLAAGRSALVLQGGMLGWGQRPLDSGMEQALSQDDDVYRRPYEGTDNPVAAMQGYLDWEYGLVAQLQRDGTHGFRVV